MPTIESVQAFKSDLIRKALTGAVFAAPGDADPILTLTTTTGGVTSLTALPTDYKSVGLISKENAPSWSRASELSETTSWGRAEPSRSDIVSLVTGLAFTAQETNRQTLELYLQQDLSAVTPTAGSGEVQITDPTTPAPVYSRLFVVARDGVGEDAIYIARFLPKAQVTESGEQAWSDGAEINYPLTITAKTDDVLGYSVRHYFGGPGWKSRLVSMGFPAAAA